MNVGFVGLGKLGLPVAYAIASRGVDVWGHDPLITGPPDRTDHEEGFADTIEAAGDRMHFSSLTEVVLRCPLIMVAVQTPHDPQFEGVTPLPEERADFDYSHLVEACRQIAAEAKRCDREPIIAVVSTVLPGTLEREIRPTVGSLPLVYNPSFIAMGTTIRDFLHPEFVLLGGDDDNDLRNFYRLLLGPFVGIRQMSITSAELAKVAYNAAIGQKIVLANVVMEIAHKTGADSDDVTGTLKAAHRRIASGAYLDGGMGDGGACHPRDNIALSWLARRLDLSFDLFGSMMEAREQQAEWLVELMCEYDLPKGILGIAYKPGSQITTGSAALLVKEILIRRGVTVAAIDDWTLGLGNRGSAWVDKRVWLIGCKHPDHASFNFAQGSVVIDPFRYIPDQSGVQVIRVGERPFANDRPSQDGGTLCAASA